MWKALTKLIEKWACGLLGHKWRYNFKWMPNKAICERCRIKAKTGDLLIDKWMPVETFDNETRTDDELIEKWIRL